jgi:hypothetical protein
VHDDFVFTTSEADATREGELGSADDEGETELLLFAGPSAATQIQKIRLVSPDAQLGEPGFLVKKPRSYYFADDTTSERENELKAAAVTAEGVLEMGKVPWLGCALPWKVRTVTAAGMKKEVLIRHNPLTLVTVEEKEHRRRRKGKKSRIALRKKTKAVAERAAEKIKLAAEKEEAEREKRTRRNREKKIKKKAREKAKKVGDGPSEGPEPEHLDEGDK